MALTKEQRQEWDAIDWSRVTGQSRELTIRDFQNVCGWEGIEVPSDADVAAELNTLDDGADGSGCAEPGSAFVAAYTAIWHPAEQP